MAQYKYLVASGQVYTGKCLCHGFMLGMDGTNDQAVTLYNGTSTSDHEIMPTNTYDAAALGLNGVVLPDSAAIECSKGLYAVLSGSGTVEIVVLYSPSLGA